MGAWKKDPYDGSREAERAPAEGFARMKQAIGAAKEVKKEQKKQRRQRYLRLTTAALCCLLVLIPNVSAPAAYAMAELPVVGPLFEAVTWRDYRYIDRRFSADVKIPEIRDSGSKRGGGENAGMAKTNAEIRAIAEELIAEFEASAAEDAGGYAGLSVDYEVLHTTEEYFCLKLITFWSSGSGAEKDYYYTIRRSDEKQMRLADLFPEGADYITPISENIKEQMRRQMQEDENVVYWIDSDAQDPAAAWDFDRIDAAQQFYIQEDGALVIAFDEGDVGPMSMGCVRFVIPQTVTGAIGLG